MRIKNKSILLAPLLSAHAVQFGSSILSSSSCPMKAPAITTIKASSQHAYVGIAHFDDGNWQGSLLKYRTVNGVMVDDNGVPIYQDNQATVKKDSWATGDDWRLFGTQGQLSWSSDRHLWVLDDKDDSFSQNLVKLTNIDDNARNRLTNYQDDELSLMTKILTDGAVGAVMNPPSIDTKSNTLLYTDSNGVLWLVDGDSGRVLSAMLLGIDASWTLHRIKDEQNHERLIAVGGFGKDKGLMAIDVSDAVQGGVPSVLYRLNNANFPQLSHIRVPVSFGYIKNDGKRQAVFVFGAGADDCYQHHADCQKKSADGAVVYAIDAITGQKIHEWSDATLPNLAIHHSFAGELSLIDRQGDGAFEHIYAADLGGQIYRFDVYGGGAVRVFAANDDGLGLFDKRRIHFYQKPIVSLYRSQDYPLYPRNSGRFALISIASNDQLPIIHGKENFVYGIFDDGLIDLKNHSLITPSSLTKIDDAQGSPNHWLGATAKSRGWYRTLMLNGDANVTLMSDGRVLPSGRAFLRQGVRSLYHLGVSTMENCLGEQKTEPQIYCLPFGVCAHHRTGQLLNTTNNTNNKSMFAFPVIQGGWTPSVAKLPSGQGLAWQVLMPNAGALTAQFNPSDDPNSPDDSDNIGTTTTAQMLRTLRFNRWYDVRSTRD